MIIVLAAWMLDRAACADMVIGAPCAELAALVELHDLLIERGFRRSSLCDPRIVKEEQNEHIAEVGFDHGASAGRGSASALHHVRFDPVAGASERTKVIACLANLLMQAAGVVTEEHADDER